MAVIVPLSPESLKARLLVWANTSSRYPFFKGNSKDLASWFEIVERACEENEIPDLQYAEAAIVFIQDDLQHVMEERRVRYLQESGDLYWEWNDFKDDIRRVIVEAEKIMAEKEKTPLDKAKDGLEKLRSEHPYIFASAGSALMISGSFVIIPMLGILALNAIGFTATGVAAGSFAAFVQSIFYRGATAGIFSVLQSMGATAVLPATGAIAGGMSAVGAGIASLVYGAQPSSNGTDSSSSNTDSPPPYSGPTSLGQPVEYSIYRSKKRGSVGKENVL
ncbi:hypothetical protein FA13DRAFT_1815388 [Coprinellus micaceus]|uniref:Uncharacterized protein n=1 Tax=Coprinellus micaceus TaxID=71717 RepID=A0A4Y7T5L2_COPMI|nr:hypothetical protein FA13DRAFT_1815388 [Coprinellus micaceus]